MLLPGSPEVVIILGPVSVIMLTAKLGWIARNRTSPTLTWNCVNTHVWTTMAITIFEDMYIENKLVAVDAWIHRHAFISCGARKMHNSKEHGLEYQLSINIYIFHEDPGFSKCSVTEYKWLGCYRTQHIWSRPLHPQPREGWLYNRSIHILSHCVIYRYIRKMRFQGFV